MNAQIVSVVRQGAYVTAACRLNEGDGRGPVEYVATVPAVDDAGKPLSAAQVKALLVEAWQARRAARPPAPQDLSAQISGIVNL